MIELAVTSGLVILGWIGGEISDSLDARREKYEKRVDAAVVLCKEDGDCEPLRLLLMEDLKK